MNQTAAGCNVSTCMYRGHRGGKIFRRQKSNSNCSITFISVYFIHTMSIISHTMFTFLLICPSLKCEMGDMFEQCTIKNL